LFDLIKQDSIFTADLRIELIRVVRQIPSSGFRKSDKYLNNFAIAIAHYFGIFPGIQFINNNEEKNWAIAHTEPEDSWSIENGMFIMFFISHYLNLMI
jgi:hypothetical protein